jgi:hypothetical protein
MTLFRSNNPYKKMMWHACMLREFNHIFEKKEAEKTIKKAEK